MSEFLPACGNRPPYRIGKASVGNRVEDLSGAARIAVGALNIERVGVVLHQRFRSVGKLQAVGIETGLQVEYEGPVAGDRLESLDADVRLTKPIGENGVPPPVAVLRDQFFNAVRVISVEGYAMGLVTAARIDGTIESDAVPGQRAFDRARLEIADGTGKAGRRWQRLRGRFHRQVRSPRAPDYRRQEAASQQ